MYKILVVGVGSIGERHLRCMLKTGRVKAGICEANVSLMKIISNRYNVPLSFSSLDKALTAENWDAAVIATPAQSHIPVAQQIANKDIALFIEKPLSTNTEGVEELMKTVLEK